MRIYILLIILFFVSGCKQNSYFTVTNIHTKLVFPVSLDDDNCWYISNFNQKSTTDTVGIAIKFNLDFFESNTQYFQAKAAVPPGACGTLDSILEVKIILSDGTHSIILPNSMSNNNDLHNVSPSSIAYSFGRIRTCSRMIYFLSIEDFINSFNSNADHISGVELSEPIVFWLDLKEYNSSFSKENTKIFIRIVLKPNNSNLIIYENFHNIIEDK